MFKARKKPKAFKIIIIVGIFLFFVWLAWYNIDGKFQEDKPMINCITNEDCRLYDCSHCGLNKWVDKTDMITDCEIRVPGLAGCQCVDGICKRLYKKD